MKASMTATARRIRVPVVIRYGTAGSVGLDVFWAETRVKASAAAAPRDRRYAGESESKFLSRTVKLPDMMHQNSDTDNAGQHRSVPRKSSACVRRDDRARPGFSHRLSYDPPGPAPVQ
jgi:hypothetical protein